MTLIRTLSAMCFLALVAARAFALDTNTQQSDLGAGPINTRVTACLLANRSHVGAPCPEPQVSQSGDKAEQAASRIARAWYFIDMQELEKARAETDLALAINPDDVKARHLAARISLTLADLPRAEADLDLALEQLPDDADIKTTHAIILQAKNAGLESMRELQAIIREHPDHLIAREQAALLAMRFGWYEAALANFNFVLERRATTKLLTERANAFLALGRPQSAAADLSAALQQEPDNPLLVKARAEAYAEGGMHDLALRDYDALLATDRGAPIHVMFADERAKLLTKRAFSYVKLRRFDDAADDVTTAISLGGTPAILRAQVLLRRNGFSDIPLDGHDSPPLRHALTACFGLDACFQGIMKLI